MAESKEKNAQEAESASYWARIHRCPWRKTGGHFYSQMVRDGNDATALCVTTVR